jgi:multiple sugar transport system substrate-binding protein
MFLSPPVAYEKQVIDHREVYEEVMKNHGKPIPLASRSTYNPATKSFFAFCDSYVPAPAKYRQDLWAEVGYPQGPDTYGDLMTGAARISDKFGNPCGLGLSRETDSDTALHALLWSFGGAEQTEEGQPALDSKNTIDAVTYMRDLYRKSETAEVFSWTPSSNNQALRLGKVSFVVDPIDVTHDAAETVQLRPTLKALNRLAPAHTLPCYVVWKFAENKEGAKQFLSDLVNHSEAACKASLFYNLPSFPSSVPDIDKLLANDLTAISPNIQSVANRSMLASSNKNAVLLNAAKWLVNAGYPGFLNAAISEAAATFVIPTMFAKAARDEMTPEKAVKAADQELRRIFAKWKQH